MEKIAAFLLVVLPQTATFANAQEPNFRGSLSDAPAKHWEDAFVSGNGRMGTMIYQNGCNKHELRIDAQHTAVTDHNSAIGAAHVKEIKPGFYALNLTKDEVVFSSDAGRHKIKPVEKTPDEKLRFGLP